MEEYRLDFDRIDRQGFPEVVYCQGKTPEQCARIFKELSQHYSIFMGTRASEAHVAAIRSTLPQVRYDSTSSIVYMVPEDFVLGQTASYLVNDNRIIAVVTAGTSDIPVAEEAAITAELMGNRVDRIYDVGVAGLHRLLGQVERIQAANVVIVVAGMEGALASVVGGLVSKPLIAVPTSVGYGASFEGLAALLAMLNSCAAGVGVVNIDNGFGAGRLAHTINSQR